MLQLQNDDYQVVNVILIVIVVSRDGLFKILAQIGCPPTLLSIVKSFHDNMKGNVSYDGATSHPFNILRGVKQGCVLAPTLFGIFFAILLKHVFRKSKKASTSKPDHMGICFNSLDSEPKPECMRNTSGTSYLQMMRPLQLTLRRTFRGFWTAFKTLVDTLDLPSAWQKHRSWGKTLRRYHRSLFTTTI